MTCLKNPETPVILAELLHTEIEENKRLVQLASDVAKAYRKHQRQNDRGGFLRAVWKLADFIEPLE